MITVLVAEDDKNIRALMAAVLKQDGYQVLEAGNGKEALILLEEQLIDLLVVDIMMPELDGYQVVSAIRKENTQLPIIMVTAKEAAEDKKYGFLTGVDDYLVKPIDFDEFLLRIKAILRRAQINLEGRLTVGHTLLDLNSFCVYQGAECTELPKKEFLLLYKLLSFQNKIFTRDQLLDDIWGIDSLTDERTVDVHIKRLREKFSGSKDFSITTIRGLGYKGVANETR
ncbi:response regulator transcription factor [Enterococcus sp. CWB-B31]|uniref:response regulator transcription factor n=1 Tax=Enterococcus sp. CWB-B31 TaxID=2885159 RepID=UPI001E61C876|nr:response regulator transcription factor [Enterococcus sp. CWB-B31]MCB5954946.1 response regulator transcription factor [Enterococcus sp. CWB-B31]